MSIPRADTQPAPFSRFVHRLAIDAPVRTLDLSGGAAVAYAVLSEIWGEVRTLTGEELLSDDRLESRTTHLVTVRYRPDLTPDHRFRLDARILAIRSVIDRDGRRRYIDCLCEEIIT